MINNLFFSIANKKANKEIEGILLELASKPYIGKNDKVAIEYSLATATKGRYPDTAYYKNFYTETESINSLSEIKLLVDQIHDFYYREYLIDATFKVINSATTKDALLQGLSSLVESVEITTTNMADRGPKSYSDMDERPADIGYLSGIPELDSCTNGFQPGTVASVCAFTGEGKSTFWVSSIYKNVKAGKKGCLFSLEMHPDIIWMQFQSRFLYEEKGLEIRAQELVQRTLTDEKKKLVTAHDAEFKEFMKGLMILDESFLTQEILKDSKLLTKLYMIVESTLGGLDFVVYDHVGQIDLIFQDMGNIAVRTFQAAGKNYTNIKGFPIFTGLAVQCNRAGWERAKKRGGVYALNAISDLNEVERSSSYIVFMFTTDDMKITQETRVTMAKNRLGAPLIGAVDTTFNPQIMTVGDLLEAITYNDDFGQINADGFNSFADEF